MAIKRNVLGIREIDCSEGLNTEEYNQVDPNILNCFPRRQYPVDLFQWKEKIRVLSPVYRRSREVGREQRKQVRELSEQGLLFFSRRQIDAYTECVACDLNAALDDPNLTWDEKAGVFICELGRRQAAFFTHPMPEELESLRTAIGSLCVYLIEDTRRMSKVVHDVHCDLSEERHNVNASLIALAVYMEMNKGSISMEILENVALGFFVYDIGMTKVSPMLLAKGQFTPRERRTLCEHPKQGLEILARLNLTRPEITEPVIQHHERLNGIGYPNKLSGDQIGQLGRIAAVSDSYCAMVTSRPRKKAMLPINAAAELVCSERKYDQVVCRTLVRFLQTVPSN
ncbi:HD domain-containing phosphohydrolase [uncultured Pseudodesulfovibrio sp.]|uniref:HD-GYP domain-containing protein n=1 Tax=uncultured Pseudodesulfovibrio sp. TaxID=2035858 RepID=UPI0029C95A66|nr:HD domain-containing phosphohydrolase [uncultured Pseudodesulfovibrio sp.]